MSVHFRGPLHTMLAAIPIMRRQRFGCIVNVSSIGPCAQLGEQIGARRSLRIDAGRTAETFGVSIHVWPIGSQSLVDVFGCRRDQLTIEGEATARLECS